MHDAGLHSFVDIQLKKETQKFEKNCIRFPFLEDDWVLL
jgi:hypothetical protein